MGSRSKGGYLCSDTIPSGKQKEELRKAWLPRQLKLTPEPPKRKYKRRLK
jgi:hypothetical protein